MKKARRSQDQLGQGISKGSLGLSKDSSLHNWWVTFLDYLRHRSGHPHWDKRAQLADKRRRRLRNQCGQPTRGTRVHRWDKKWSIPKGNSAKTEYSRPTHQKGNQTRIRGGRSRPTEKSKRLWRRETRCQLEGPLQNSDENQDRSLQPRRSHKRTRS